MRKLSLFFALALFFWVSCSDEKTADMKDSAATACERKPINPNGDSELAILMRELANWNDSCKAAIQSGRAIPAKPAKLNTLLTAKKTDETIDINLYNSMASLYQGRVAAFEASTDENRIDLYNGMVTGCVSCHENFCGGPLVRINKMFISK